VPLDGLVKDLDGARIRGIRQDRTVAVEDKTRGFHFAAYRRGIDAVQSLRDIGRGAGCGCMVEDDVPAAGLQGIEHGFVERGDVLRTKVRVMEIVVVLRDPEEIELPGQAETLERSLD
jgi:hypothetical protein